MGSDPDQNCPVLKFHQGTLILEGWMEEKEPPCFKWDPRVRKWRAPAISYSKIITIFDNQRTVFLDQAPSFEQLDLKMNLAFTLYPHQKEALAAWLMRDKRGSVILPTGSGKSLVALHAMAAVSLPTLVVAPTIDLMNQWYDLISDEFGYPVGILGGGHHEILPLTVTTYDSAFRHMDQYGSRFGLLIFDEIHHLPAATYSQIPELSLAPYRLGLTATYKRMDAQHVNLNHLVGPVVYEKRIRDLKGQHLSDYEIHKISITLTPEEQETYNNFNESYHSYVSEKGIRFYGEKWNQFIKESAYTPKARKAMLARKEMRRVMSGAEQKLDTLESLLKLHHKQRIIIFTESNDLVYAISNRYLIPVLTHHTDTVERKEILDRFKKGAYRYLVTSKVLNEGVDVPEANVAIILGGSASPTEHLQRLGRILRKKSGKKAILYEIVTSGTKETNISYRRRGSDAYR